MFLFVDVRLHSTLDINIGWKYRWMVRLEGATFEIILIIVIILGRDDDEEKI